MRKRFFHAVRQPAAEGFHRDVGEVRGNETGEVVERLAEQGSACTQLGALEAEDVGNLVVKTALVGASVSADNDFSFWPTERSLSNLLVAAGLGQVYRAMARRRSGPGRIDTGGSRIRRLTWPPVRSEPDQKRALAWPTQTRGPGNVRSSMRQVSGAEPTR